MKPSVYIETTIPSYLTAWPSRDLVRAAHQRLTIDWWDNRRTDFNLFISEVVVAECRKGDPQAAAERLEVLQDIPMLDLLPAAQSLAEELLAQVPLPEKATTDALHIAIAAVHKMNYLLTWNFSHIANETLRGRIEEVCKTCGYVPPRISTPSGLMEKG
jgi:predicted nucleic acid-binding protein